MTIDHTTLSHISKVLIPVVSCNICNTFANVFQLDRWFCEYLGKKVHLELDSTERSSKNVTKNREKSVPSSSIHHVDWIYVEQNDEGKHNDSSNLFKLIHFIFTCLALQNTMITTFINYLILHIDVLNLVKWF